MLVSMQFQVLFHSPNRGSFHLSLTVLVHYRSQMSIEPWKMVLPNSHRVSRVPWYLGARQERKSFCLQVYHLLWRPFPWSSAGISLCNSLAFMCKGPSSPTTPPAQRAHAYMSTVWAVPRSLAATGGISVDFCSSRY